MKPQHHSPGFVASVAMGIEDQQEERGVLESIFPDEITGSSLPLPRKPRKLMACADVSETEFRILVKLDDGRHEDDESEEAQRISPALSQGRPI